MSKYIQLVAVRVNDGSHDAYLYRAPRWACSVGDIVLVNFGGVRQGTVLMTQDEDMAGDYGRGKAMAIVEAFGAHWPLQPVLLRLVKREVEFDKEDWTPEDDLEKEEEEDDDAVRPD